MSSSIRTPPEGKFTTSDRHGRLGGSVVANLGDHLRPGNSWRAMVNPRVNTETGEAPRRLAVAGLLHGVPDFAVSSRYSALRRVVIRPGAPSPIVRPSSSITLASSPIVPVQKRLVGPVRFGERQVLFERGDAVLGTEFQAPLRASPLPDTPPCGWS